jgi:DedD protein
VFKWSDLGKSLMVAIDDPSLSIKKRARRRLVGAIALVILMLIILPNILKNRADSDVQGDIKITMDDSSNLQSNTPIQSDDAVNEVNDQQDDVGFDVVQDEEDLTHEISAQENVGKIQDKIAVKVADDNIQTVTSAPIVEDSLDASESESKAIALDQSKQAESISTKPEAVAQPKVEKLNQPEKKIDASLPRANLAKSKASEPYLIQVGAFSDKIKVKELQAKIALSGFRSTTSVINTSNGEMVRLRVGAFVTRQAAADALKKLQDNGLTGMIVSSQ